jgi:two-component system sensor histidine kinase RegB
VRVRTIVTLRWVAIAGQLIALAVTGLHLDYPLPWLSALAAVAAAALLNLGLMALYPRNARIMGPEALVHLGFDLVQLGVLLFLTGGLANPFCVLLVVPVTIAATLLSARATMALIATAAIILIGLWLWALPLPWAAHPIFLPPLYRLGILIGLLLAMTFLAAYVWQVSAEGRRRQLALIATQSALERESRMSALGALAAAAAHELGGPLGTLALVAKDLEAGLRDDPVHGPDVRLLAAEVARARAILLGIARRAEAEDPFPRVALPVLLHELARPYEGAGQPVVEVVAEPPLAEARVSRTPELLHGLANLVDNAVRHARSRVELAARLEGSTLLVTVSDDGSGFPEHLLPKLGEPFLGPSRSGRGGTGLGLFIATTLLERTGARLDFANCDKGGARVAIRWHAPQLLEETGERESPWPVSSMPS